MPFVLTKQRAAEFHRSCPSGADRHSMSDYMLEDAKFTLGTTNSKSAEVLGRFGHRDDDPTDTERDLKEFFESTACYF